MSATREVSALFHWFFAEVLIGILAEFQICFFCMAKFQGRMLTRISRMFILEDYSGHGCVIKYASFYLFRCSTL